MSCAGFADAGAQRELAESSFLGGQHFDAALHRGQSWRVCFREGLIEGPEGVFDGLAKLCLSDTTLGEVFQHDP